MSIFFFYTFILTSFLLPAQPSIDSSLLKGKALSELKTVLRTQSEWTKVHAAEYLISIGYKGEVYQSFLKENELYGATPAYRIGIWRVLAQSDPNRSSSTKWTKNILDAFGNEKSPDRLHAAETLGKLKISPLKHYPIATQQALSGLDQNLTLYTLWATSYRSGKDKQNNKKRFLQTVLHDRSDDARFISSYILRRIKELTIAEWQQIARTAHDESDSSNLKMSLLTTAFITAEDQRHPLFLQIKQELLKNYTSFSAGKRIELAMALAENGSKTDLPILSALLNEEQPHHSYDRSSEAAADARAAAAFAILKLLNKK